MDYGNALGVEYRVVKDAEHDGQPARVVSGARTYETSQEDLWDALTNAERIPRWFLPITGDLKLGGRYQLEGNAGGKITRCDSPESLEVTWEYADNVSWVTVRLEPDGDGTRLTLKSGEAVDQAESHAWMASEPGKSFIRECAKAWGVAHIKSGEAADVRDHAVGHLATSQGIARERVCNGEHRWRAAYLFARHNWPA